MNSSKAESTAYRECCTDSKCESGLRNNYYEGKRLSVDSFRVEQQYLLERRRLLNRAIHGWGVVYGYRVTTSQTSGWLEIGAGLALDQWGRELLETKTTIEVTDVIILGPHKKDAKKVCTYPNAAEAEAALRSHKNDYKNDSSSQVWWLLSVHYAEQKSAPVTVEGSCRCEHEEWDHTCETVRYSLQPVWSAKCCSEFSCDLKCNCCDEPIDPAHVTLHKRGGCCCLCEHLTQLDPKGECGSLCEIEERCTRVRVDIRNGVPLACAPVKDNGGWAFDKEVEECGSRRLVKRNDLLFDLINGCDLTRISGISWAGWHRRQKPIPFEDFSNALGYLDPEKQVALGNPDKERKQEAVHEFSVEFSRKVDHSTLRPDCFAMTIMTVEPEGCWWETHRVPIVDVKIVDVKTKSNDLVTKVTMVFDEGWVKDAVRGYGNIFRHGVSWVELEVRGDFIVDCNGQTVDANAVGDSAAPSGNGTPGGVFLSTFRVEPSDQYSSRAAR